MKPADYKRRCSVVVSSAPVASSPGCGGRYSDDYVSDSRSIMRAACLKNDHNAAYSGGCGVQQWRVAR